MRSDGIRRRYDVPVINLLFHAHPFLCDSAFELLHRGDVSLDSIKPLIPELAAMDPRNVERVFIDGICP